MIKKPKVGGKFREKLRIPEKKDVIKGRNAGTEHRTRLRGNKRACIKKIEDAVPYTGDVDIEDAYKTVIHMLEMQGMI